ncbi:hypothetical protein DMB95_05555 [Campylobacter sp. MIT 12-8780]|uniref:hypothetical protein n=1 Tax=unclassified Campylobacter TaxID=2593542 RepID=UPI0010F9E0A6|nr:MULTISPECIES: hypothetical protein [unclassified Campylobacter]NDJ27566.1 hypothetical protein [Campylobacter sp. MIT 19-121]TKX28835.1 hypothetical protein CQA38_06760 [Campylobacter sp. MIT 12-5580]TQR41318.1 hypothetical protein DMB95_05555 [Campylobacter sp. MIT 12-8780]
MKRFLLTLFICLNAMLASDELSIDSLFKKQIGLRSITSFSLLSTGNANSYSLYPNITISGDPTIWNDTKQGFLSQTFVYTLHPKFDILVSASASYARHEYTNFFTNEYSSKTRIGFDNLWLGFIYTADSIADLIPQITLQTALVQREKVINNTKNFYLKSQSLQASLRGYSDPVVYSLYAGFGYNAPRFFDIGKVEYGHSIYVGGDLSIILSPKITLDLGAQQRFQTKQKINGYQNSEIRSIPTLNLGSTYSINSDTAVSLNASFGGSSASPDSIFGLSIWKKF